VDALPLLIDPQTDRLHTTFQQAVASTGRLSSVDPNLQTIPIRTELGRKIRGAFIAPEGFELVSGDYSQIELRVLAHLSKDPVLLEAFRSGEDVHTRTAMEIFSVTDRSRRSTGVAPGRQLRRDHGREVAWPELRILAPKPRPSSLHFRRYQGVRRRQNQTLDGARASRASTLARTATPHTRHRSGNRARRLAAERIAMNALIQGTAADI
jgi:DNA polymerase-1